MGVVFPQTTAMTDSHEGDAKGLGVIVHDLFGIESDAAGAFVEDGVSWAVVEETGHGYALLETAGENVTPLSFGVPAFVVELDEVLEAKDLEDIEEIVVRDGLGPHLAERVGVDDLLAEGATGEIGALGDVEDGVEGRLIDGAAVNGPETAEDTEEGGFAAAVGTNDEKMVTVLEREREGLDENVAVG